MFGVSDILVGLAFLASLHKQVKKSEVTQYAKHTCAVTPPQLSLADNLIS
jgi:hypothetical protein